MEQQTYSVTETKLPETKANKNTRITFINTKPASQNAEQNEVLEIKLNISEDTYYYEFICILHPGQDSQLSATLCSINNLNWKLDTENII